MPVADCPNCQGTGWKIRERDGVSSANRCECIFQGREQRLEERAHIPPLYQAASLDNFVRPSDNPTASKELGNVIRMVLAYIRDYPVLPEPGLLFIGPPGTGKTHLAIAALRALIAKGFEGVFFDFQNLLDRISSGFNEASGTTDKEAYRTALETEIVVLDDLGARRVSGWVEDTITSIVTYRCNHKKATIVTTNLFDPQAGDNRSSGPSGDVSSKFFLEERIGMRARSRLFEMCRLVKMPYVEDYRLKRKLN